MKSKCIKSYQKITQRGEFPPCQVAIQDSRKDSVCSVKSKPEKQQMATLPFLKKRG